jgi:hypothetical protein
LSERCRTVEGAESRTTAWLDWQRRAIIALQVVSILVVRAAAVLAITTVGASGRFTVNDHANGSTDRPSVPLHAPSNSARLVAFLQDAVRRRLAAGQSYAGIAQQTGIPKPYLSLLTNHFDRLRREEPVLGLGARCRLADRLSIGINLPQQFP